MRFPGGPGHPEVPVSELCKFCLWFRGLSAPDNYQGPDPWVPDNPGTPMVALSDLCNCPGQQAPGTTIKNYGARIRVPRGVPGRREPSDQGIAAPVPI